MVDRVKGVEKVTDNPFLNLYNLMLKKKWKNRQILCGIQKEGSNAA